MADPFTEPPADDIDGRFQGCSDRGQGLVRRVGAPDRLEGYVQKLKGSLGQRRVHGDVQAGLAHPRPQLRNAKEKKGTR